MMYDELVERINELVTQWSEWYPEYELVVISLPKKGIEQRKRLLREISDYLEKERFD